MGDIAVSHWRGITHMGTINETHMMYDMVPEIWSKWWAGFFVILDHVLPFYPPNNSKTQNFGKMKQNTWRYYYFTNVQHKWQSYDVWFLRYWVQQAEVIVILDFFCSFTLPPSPNNPKNWNFEKMNNHMMYGSSDMKRDRQNFLSF